MYKESLSVIGGPFLIRPTKNVMFKAPGTTKDGVDVMMTVVMDFAALFDILVTAKNCSPQCFKVHLAIAESDSFDSLLGSVLDEFKQSAEDKPDHIIYYPDFKKLSIQDDQFDANGDFNINNFRIVSKVDGISTGEKNNPGSQNSIFIKRVKMFFYSKKFLFPL